MALWTWRTLPDERVEVDRGDGNGFQALPLAMVEHPAMQARLKRVLQWLPLAEKYGAKSGVPPSWILGFINAESGGDPKAEHYSCAGLMAIFWSIHGKKGQDMLAPDKNIDYGTSLLAKMRAQGHDLPATASLYVAGGSRREGNKIVPKAGTCCSAMCRESCKKCTQHPNYPGGSPWGMCEHMMPRTDVDGSVGYIDRVVRGNNYFAEALQGRVKPPPELPAPPPATASAGGKLLWVAAGAAAGYAGIMMLPKLR